MQGLLVSKCLLQTRSSAIKIGSETRGNVSALRFEDIEVHDACVTNITVCVQSFFGASQMSNDCLQYDYCLPTDTAVPPRDRLSTARPGQLLAALRKQ